MGRPVRSSSLLKSAPVAAMALALGLLAAPHEAAAQLQISHSPSTAPDLGRMVRGSGATSFTISTNGAVTRTSGDGIRVDSGSATPPTITISCGFLNLSNLCALRRVRVTVQPIPNSDAQITRFTVNSLTGNLLWATQAPQPASSLTFDMLPLGLLGTGSFTLGMDVWTSGALAGGQYSFGYSVTVAFI